MTNQPFLLLEDGRASYTTGLSVLNETGVELILADRNGVRTILPPRKGIPDFGAGKVLIRTKVEATCLGGVRLTSIDDTPAGKERHKSREQAIEDGRKLSSHTWYAGDPKFSSLHQEMIEPPLEGEPYVNRALGIIIARECDIEKAIRKEGLWSCDALVPLEASKLGDDPGIPVLSEAAISILTSKAIVVDRDGRLPPLWTNVFGQAVRIPVLNGSNLEDGIHMDVDTTAIRGRKVRIDIDDPKLLDRLKECNIHTSEFAARVGQTSKIGQEAIEQLKVAQQALKKKNKEFEELKRQFDAYQAETKLFKSNKQSNLILDVAKFIWTILGVELKGLVKGVLNFGLFA